MASISLFDRVILRNLYSIHNRYSIMCVENYSFILEKEWWVWNGINFYAKEHMKFTHLEIVLFLSFSQLHGKFSLNFHAARPSISHFSYLKMRKHIVNQLTWWPQYFLNEIAGHYRTMQDILQLIAGQFYSKLQDN